METLIDPLHEYELASIPWLTNAYKPGINKTYKDFFWYVKDGCALFYRNKKYPYAYPQCNQDLRMMEYRLKTFPGCHILELAWAFVPYHEMP